MKELFPNIYKVYRDESSGGWGYSYFVKRDSGNLLLARMARTASIESEYETIHAMGGIDRIYITDWHFAGSHVEDVSKEFDAPIYCSAIEAPTIKEKSDVESLKTFDYTLHDIEDGLTIVPTPGHTKGGVCYLLDMDNTRYLFTGDLLYFDGNRWIVGSRKYAKVKEGFDRMQAQDFDYLVGCGDDDLGIPYVALNADNKSAFFEDVIQGIGS